jgi:uncharacterized protein YyaL (SSP411 family)
MSPNQAPEAVTRRQPSLLYAPLDMRHLKQLTDASGIIQHGHYSIPNRRTGYCVDDNARALLVALEHHRRTLDPESLRLASTYLSFIRYAQISGGQFHNFAAYDQSFLDDVGSEDCQGRAIWALGVASAAGFAPPTITEAANHLFEEAARHIPKLISPRARSYAMLGLEHHIERSDSATPARDLAADHGERMLTLLKRHSAPGWNWFEPVLAYANAILPLGLISAARICEEPKLAEVALSALDFLMEVTIQDGVLQPVGNNGWYRMGRRRARFDQQVIDAADMVLACLAAHRWSWREQYLEAAKTSFEWFFGRNVHGLPLYDPASGGCCDGLTPRGVNQNQGAESIVCYLLAHMAYIPDTM